MSNRKNRLSFYLDRWFDILIFILLAGLYLGYTTVTICFVAIIIRLSTTNRLTAAVFLMVFSGYASSLSMLLGEGMWRLIPVFLGVALAWQELLVVIRRYGASFVALFIVLAYIYITALYGPMNYTTMAKLQRLPFAFVMLGAMLIVNSYKKVSFKATAQILMFSAILTIAAGFMIGYDTPSSIFDFGFFRDSVQFYISNDFPYISYHEPALAALIGLVFLISPKKIKIKDPFFLISVGMLIWITFMVQARQAILGVFIVIILRILLQKIAMWRKVVIVIAFTSVALFAITHTGTEYLEAATDEQASIDERLNRSTYEISIEKIKQAPMFGAGLGGYTDTPFEYSYPHNIVLELWVECGLMGLIFITIIIIIYLNRNKIGWRYMTFNASYFWIIVVAYGIRAMISSSINENIILICAMLAMVKHKKQVIEDES